MADESERLARIETIFGYAARQACKLGIKVDGDVRVDARADHVNILVAGHSMVLFRVNAEGSIQGPVLGFHNATTLGSINDDGIESNIAWAIKNELSDQIKPR